jgi:hypothetical protein
MENDKPTILNQGMKFGLILGLTQIAISLLLYLIDKTLLVSMWVGFTILVISIVLMVLPVKSFKKMQGGIITFKGCFSGLPRYSYLFFADNFDIQLRFV